MKENENITNATTGNFNHDVNNTQSLNNVFDSGVIGNPSSDNNLQNNMDNSYVNTNDIQYDNSNTFDQNSYDINNSNLNNGYNYGPENIVNNNYDVAAPQYEEVEIKRNPQEFRTDSYFDGKLLELIGWTLLKNLITVITLGIALP